MVGAASNEIQESLLLDDALPFSVVLKTVINMERVRREVRERAMVTMAANSTPSGEDLTRHVRERERKTTRSSAPGQPACRHSPSSFGVTHARTARLVPRPLDPPCNRVAVLVP